ncbi:MAG: DUF882 domain-containing protein [Kofleriaceae bacterium]|nr:DUF882 domain-containing protein [Kofleriaceae bacterium]
MGRVGGQSDASIVGATYSRVKPIDLRDFRPGSPISGDLAPSRPSRFRAHGRGTALVQGEPCMKANQLRARHAVWLAPCVCLAVLVLYPAKAEPVSQPDVVHMPVVRTPSPPIVEAPVPTTVHVVLTRGHKRLELELPLDGKVSATDADEIARLMRCPESGRTRRIASGTLALLADVAARYPGHEIEVVSAVRAEPERSREGIKHSKHWDGHAIDLIVRDAKLTEVRDVMWKNHRDVGIGWYPTSGFIHLDYRPDVHDTSWTQARPNADNQYNPRWARLARDPDAQRAASCAKMRRFFATSATLSTLAVSIADSLGYSTACIARTPRNS